MEWRCKYNFCGGCNIFFSHRKHLMTQKGKNCKEAKSRPARPPNKAAVIEWFMEEEYEKGSGRNPNTNKVADWFHGKVISFYLYVTFYQSADHMISNGMVTGTLANLKQLLV